MKKCNLGYSPLTKKIYAGIINKKNMTWKGEKVDITEEAIKVVFEKMMAKSQKEGDKIIKYHYGDKFGKLCYIPNKKEDNKMQFRISDVALMALPRLIKMIKSKGFEDER